MSIYRGKSRKEFYLASLLYDSIEDRDFSSVKSLLTEKGADPNLVLPNQGIAPFHLVIGCDPEEFATSVTNLILQCGGNPNIQSEDGLTPVHIAAAWGRYEILKLLLNCGGDTEIRDINYKTPLHYAYEENFADCLNLLKAYLPVRNKVIINNGTVRGEYELINEYKTDKPTSINSNLTNVNLAVLPASDTKEYVMNWFNSHHNIVNTDTQIETKNPAAVDAGTASSPDESMDESMHRFKLKRVFKKTRNTPKKNCVINNQENDSEEEDCKTPTKAIEKIDENLKNPNISTIVIESSSESDSPLATKLDFTEAKEFSKESGILTLPQTSMESFQELSTIEADQTDVISIQKPETSSDYLTCSAASLLDKNIFEITEDISINNNSIENVVQNDESHSNKSSLSIQSEGVSSAECSFVSVSEIYKIIDKDEGIVLFEKRLLRSPGNSESGGSLKSSSFSSKLSSLPETVDYDTDTLRKELTNHGFNAGPITVTTKRVYLKKLRQLKKYPQLTVNTQNKSKKVYSVELEKTFRDSNWLTTNISIYKSLEESVSKQFSQPDPSRKWREGVNKSSFTYLLLDPRVTNNLPCRSELLQPEEIWKTFLSSIFYIGKGKRSRPYQHLYEAVTMWNDGVFKTDNKKLQHIMDIWKNNQGVICLHVFQNIIPVEAYTREAAMISALKIENLRNIKSGDFYGIAATWSQKQKRMYGVYLLYKAMMIFLNEGERQLCPSDID